MNLAWNHAGQLGDDVVDPVLGALAPRLDPHHAGETLARAGIDVRGPIAVENVWYNPTRHLVVVYRRGVGTAADALVVARYGDAPPSLLPDGAHAIPGGLAWQWPNDPGALPLGTWQSPAWNGERLREAGVALPGLKNPRVLSYLPGKRCALLWHGADGRPCAVMKAQDGVAASHAAMMRLWRDPRRRFAMAEPLAMHAPSGVRWERFMSGIRIERAASNSGWSAALDAVLSGLVQLHATPVPDLPILTDADVLRRLDQKVMRRIAGALPGLEATCQGMQTEFARSSPGRQMRTTLHGDLHTGNVLLAPGGDAVFIDLDSLTQGPPAYDLALLGSRLILIGLLDPTARAGLGATIREIPRTYARAGGDPDAVIDYPWYLAVLLIARQIKTCIRHGAPQMGRLSSQLLAVAQHVHRAGGFDDSAWPSSA